MSANRPGRHRARSRTRALATTLFAGAVLLGLGVLTLGVIR